MKNDNVNEIRIKSIYYKEDWISNHPLLQYQYPRHQRMNTQAVEMAVTDLRTP